MRFGVVRVGSSKCQHNVIEGASDFPGLPADSQPGEIARVGVRVVHDDRIVLHDRHAADSLAYGNAPTLGWRFAKWTHDQSLQVSRDATIW